MITIAILIVFWLILDHKYHPRIDYTREGKYLLWYDKNGSREYKVIIDTKK